jgi:hypothetical protein
MTKEYPFIEKVARAMSETDGQDPNENWQYYEEMAISAIRTIKEHFDEQKIRR